VSSAPTWAAQTRRAPKAHFKRPSHTPQKQLPRGSQPHTRKPGHGTSWACMLTSDTTPHTRYPSPVSKHNRTSVASTPLKHHSTCLSKPLYHSLAPPSNRQSGRIAGASMAPRPAPAVLTHTSLWSPHKSPSKQPDPQKQHELCTKQQRARQHLVPCSRSQPESSLQ
jgi:hypothetical protein